MPVSKQTSEQVHQASFQRRVRARAFRDDGGGSYTQTVPGGQGLTYVRIDGINGAMGLSLARDAVGLSSPTDDNKPIWVVPDSNGIWLIVDRRWEG